MPALRAIEATIYDPAATARVVPGRAAIVLAADPDAPDGVAERSEIAVELTGPDLQPRAVRAILSRSLTSTYELFHAVAGDRLIVSDRLDHVRAMLPPERRGADPDALVDHMLFRAAVGETSFCAAIRRVRRGARVVIDLAAGVTRVEQTARIVALPPVSGDPLPRLAAALDASVRAAAGCHDPALLFSGGVDSVLAASHLPDAPLVHAAISCPEFAPETAMARAAAFRLGRPLIEAEALDEEALLTAMETVAARCGGPQHHAMTVLVDRAIARAGRDVIVGADGDALFGLVNPYDMLLGVPARRPALRAAIAAAGRLIPGRAGAALRRAAAVGPGFALPVGEPDSYARSIKTAVNALWAQRAFGEQAVAARLQARWDHMLALGLTVDPDSRDPLDHLAARQLMAFFCNDTMSVWRALATARGRRIATPFADERMLRAVIATPAAGRYVTGRTVKPLLRRLVEARVPGYPARARKLGGALPLARLTARTSLGRMFEIHPAPDPFRGLEAALLAEPEAEPFWRVASYAVWLSVSSAAPPPDESRALTLSFPAG